MVLENMLKEPTIASSIFPVMIILLQFTRQATINQLPVLIEKLWNSKSYAYYRLFVIEVFLASGFMYVRWFEFQECCMLTFGLFLCHSSFQAYSI